MTDAGIEKFTGLKPVPPKNRGAAAMIGQRVVFLKQADTPYFKGEVEAKIPLSALGAQYQIRDRITAIDLPNGEVLCVALSLDDLENRLYGLNSLDDEINLCDVTGLNVEKILKPEKFQDLSHEIGTFVPNEGIYIGMWNPKNENGISLGRIFDLYAAPKDVRRYINMNMTFNKLVQYIPTLENWHGHDGADFKSEAEVTTAIREHRFEELEKWFIPTEEILENHLYKNKNTKSLRNSFKGGPWYWSCTKTHDLAVCSINFLKDKKRMYRDKTENIELSTRLVRAKLRRPAQP